MQSEDSTFVTYGGRPLVTGEECFWKVRVWRQDGRATAWSEPARWSMGIFNEGEWYGRFIGGPGPSFPWLRKTVNLDRKPRRATAYVNALGYYELYVNGRKVDDSVLAPAVSDYSKRTIYVTHDITDYLVAGKNSLALWLGRGWYVQGHPGVIHDGPLVRAQFEIAITDDDIVKVGTDERWKVHASPITPLGKGTAFGDYGGEHYDARFEIPGWNTAAYDDSRWDWASVFDPPHTVTAAQMVEPNRIVETLKAVKIEENPAGAWLIDMGRNYVGWLDLTLSGGHSGRRTRQDRVRRLDSHRAPLGHLQSARRVRNACRRADHPLALQLSRLPLRARHRADESARAHGQRERAPAIRTGYDQPRNSNRRTHC